MKPVISDAATIATRWSTITQQRSTDYTNGVKNPKKSWASNASAAEANYKTAVVAAANGGRFGKGITKAGDAKWQSGAVGKGTVRRAPGVSTAQPAYQAGFAPYREVIANTDLSPSYPKGDPRNYDRSKAIGTALHNAKSNASA